MDRAILISINPVTVPCEHADCLLYEGRYMARSEPVAVPIEIRVESLSQLFNTLDPFPFSERDLDKDAEEYIVSWARELPHDHVIRILIHLPASELAKHAPGELAQAINRYFRDRAEVATRELHELFRIGRMALAIGMSVLALCLVTAQFALRHFGETPFGLFAEQSLIMFGWVANWRPIEIVLYDWWPIVRRRNLYRRLAHATVELIAP